MIYARSLDQLLLLFVFFAAAQDLAARRIPNRLVGAGLASALLLHGLAGPPWAVLASGMAGAATGLALFMPLYLVRGMAAGDVKLLAMVGAFCGPRAAGEIALATCCIGGLMALAMLAVRGELRQAMRNVAALLRPLLWRLAGVPLASVVVAAPPSVGGMPYGVAIALGTALVLFWRSA